ncbi:MAG: hypothetical protein ACLQBX_03610 [Candidatus Limnocylindrales bacterium]
MSTVITVVRMAQPDQLTPTYIDSHHAQYEKARDGTGAVDFQLYEVQAGQEGPEAAGDGLFYCAEGLVTFDTSVLAGKSIVSATLVMPSPTFYNTGSSSFVVEARLTSWGAAGQPWVPAASLGSLPLLATLDASNGNSGSFKDVAMAANINASGTTQLLLCTDHHRLGIKSYGNEWVSWWLGTPQQFAAEYFGLEEQPFPTLPRLVVETT